ncbi:MAG: GAF domain-containing protein [Ardenticatenaceae bacterium]|nr:GAF domain-containing protein [Ardenticatenaceae bacterium]
MIDRSIQRWLEMPLEIAHEDDELLVYILHIIQLSLLGATLFALLIFTIFRGWFVIRTLMISLCLLLISLWLSQRHHKPILAGATIVFTLLGFASYFLYVGYGVRDEAMLLYTLTLLIGSLLLSRLAYIFLVVITVSYVSWLGYLEISGQMQFATPSVSIPAVVIVVVVLLITAVISRSLASGLRKSLAQSRQNEQSLAETTAFLAIVNTIADALHHSLHPQTVAEQAAQLIAQHFNVPLVAVHAFDPIAEQLFPLIIYSKDGPTEALARSLPVNNSLSGLAIRQKETIISQDIAHDSRAASVVGKLLAEQGYQGAVAVPIIFQDSVLGSLNLIYKPDYPVSEDIVAKLTPIAQSISLAMHNAQMMQERQQAEQSVRQYARRALALSEMSQHLAEVTHDYGRVLTLIAHRLAELIGDSCSISLISEDGQWLEMTAIDHPNPEFVAYVQATMATMPQRIDEGHVGRVIASGQPLLLPETALQELQSTMKPEYRQILERFPMYSRVLAPLRVQGKIIGVTDLTRLSSGKSYTEDDMLFLQDLADRAAMAISSARLYAALQQELQERKRAEAVQEKLIEQLAAKNEELEHFAYTVSHDLKSPLVTIRGFLGFVEQDASKGNMERLRSDMQHIYNATDKMQSLLQELLELSRIGRITNPSQAVPFRELVQEAVHLVLGQLAEQQIVVNIAPDLPVVQVDKPRIIGALQNLLSNAVKFMGDQPNPHVEIGAAEQGEKTVFFVRDNGIGIDPAYHQKVFGLFDRLNPDIEGSGIGLALVKRIIEVHNGRIWVESAGAGQGSTFYFTLPVVSAPTAPDGFPRN